MSAPVASPASSIVRPARGRSGDAMEPETESERERARGGGKAAGLFLLQRAGVDVPPFVVVEAQLLDEWAKLARWDETVRDEASARERLAQTPPPPSLRHALHEAIATLPPGPLAVRSSALDEDSAERSHAGQFESVLFVDGEEALAAATARCLASTLSGRARMYRAATSDGHNTPDATRPRLGVVVQSMVEGDVSGVAFTADPSTGVRDRIVVSAALGLCEGVVQGSVSADTYTFSRSKKTLDSDVTAKSEAVRRSESGAGTVITSVAADVACAPALDEPSCRELIDLLVCLEEKLGHPLDVEWTRVKGRFVFLQVRPITTLPAEAPPTEQTAGTRELVWDNANIVESFSGPTTAMTFSYIRFAYSVAYQQSCELGGVPASEIKENLPTFQSMLGFHDGRVYYNLASWYGLLSLFPRFEKNKEHMERMMGVRESALLMARAPVRTSLQRARMALAWLSNLRRVDTLVADFQARLAQTLEEWPAERFSSMSLAELSEAFRVLVWRLLWHWQAPLVTDFAAMMSFGVLVDLTKRWGVDESGALANDLLGGEGDVASLEPTRSLLRLADTARKDAALKALLEETPDALCLEVVRAHPQHAAFSDALHKHLALWGDRCIGELKLEEPSLVERPAFLFSMLKNYLRREGTSAETMEHAERERRTAAETRVRAAVRSPFKRAAYFWILRQTRKHMKNRESMRFGRTRTFALLRRLLLRAGDLFVMTKRLEQRDDVFHLTIDELMGFIDGTAVSSDLRGLAAVRKAEHARHIAATDPPDRFVTRGAVGIAAREARQDVEANADGTVKGTPCSPGRVRAKVRVIQDPNALLAAVNDPNADAAWRLHGEILVAARTDPGWVPLYPSVSGLLVERGSPLSHSAIVARELGLPTIVNIPGLLATVKDGAIVEMDGATGMVKVVSS